MQTRNCAVCQKIFLSQRASNVYCSKACSNRARTVPAEVRYWSKVIFGEPDECWGWRGTKSGGYGMLQVGGRPIGAHRFGYLVVHGGELRSTQDVLHTCIGRRDCQNPLHWYVGTDQDNAADRVAQGRQLRGERIGGTILTESQVREIRSRRAVGQSITYIALDFPEVSYKALVAVCARRTWKHVP